MGISVSTSVSDPVAYSTIAWVMTLGIMSGLIIITFFSRKIHSGLDKIQGKDKKWGEIFNTSLFMGMISALFGALAVVFVSKNWKIAMAPLIFMLIIFISFPALSSSVSIMVPVGVIIALGVSRILYKKGYL